MGTCIFSSLRIRAWLVGRGFIPDSRKPHTHFSRNKVRGKAASASGPRLTRTPSAPVFPVKPRPPRASHNSLKSLAQTHPPDLHKISPSRRILFPSAPKKALTRQLIPGRVRILGQEIPPRNRSCHNPFAATILSKTTSFEGHCCDAAAQPAALEDLARKIREGGPGGTDGTDRELTRRSGPTGSAARRARPLISQ